MGKKFDLWLVKTVGLLIVACSLGIISASFRKYIQPDVSIIMLNVAAFLSGIDIYYVLNNRISAVYLADAAIELGLITAWAYWFIKIKPKANKNQVNTV